VFEARHTSLKVCVLGGTGFVGTELVSRLAGAGHWVRVPTRQRSYAGSLRVLDTVEVLAADVHDPRMLGPLFAGMDVVVNLIGILNENRRTTFASVHAELARKVVAAARRARVRRLLHMSSLGADPDGPSRYLRSKAAAELHVRAAASELPFAIMRPSVIFGPGDSLTRRFAQLLQLSAGVLPLARAKSQFAPIAVQDVAEAFLRVLNAREVHINETYELCGPDVMSLGALVRETARAAGLPCHILPLPDFVAYAQAVVMQLLPSKPFSLDNLRSLSRDSVCRENGCARLGIVPRPMASELALYLGDDAPQARLNRYRRLNDLET
jgi:NADH dehydrogenase